MHRREAIRIAELANEQSMVENDEFDNCEIVGPAVIGIVGPGVEFHGNDFGGTLESTFIEAPDRPLQGIIGLRRVTFRGCRFRNVAIMAPPEIIQQFAEDMRR